MAAVGMMIVVFMLIIGGLIYLIISALICVGLSKNKKTRLLYFALFLALPLLVATLNYYGFCFKKMRFLNEQDIYAILNNSEYKEPSNDCYGAYVFARKKMYGNFDIGAPGERGYLHTNSWIILERILGVRYAMVQTGYTSLIISNCGSFYHNEF